jgi:hypothetical protein
MRNTKLAIAALAIAPGIALLAVPAASASPHAATTTYKATTSLTARPDGGNGGTWATDTTSRTLAITATGTPGHYVDTATVTDTGTFALIGGALAPNQSTPGVRITARPQVLYTQISGTAHYSFTSDSLPSSAPNLGVPRAEAGAPVTPQQGTPDWYAQAFGPSAVVSQDGITDYSWTYNAGVNHFGALEFQQWTDSSSNADGNLPGDGNITG